MGGTEEQQTSGTAREGDAGRAVDPARPTDPSRPRPVRERVLPDQSVDDTDRGWGEHSRSNDERLLAERPPHWE
ncbi:hypothetical protein [Plantactinospora sp. CA-290183]|uniref:hypothetical protein n=1 Tax=Plantactinospora sp. CA-290183 TaxID=3240006 RepID=UPI003D939885